MQRVILLLCQLNSQAGNRVVDINHRLRRLKQQANAKLKSERGITYRKKRPADVEPVFANLKHNKPFKRFMLKGIAKVEIETGLLAFAHNLAKIAAWPPGLFLPLPKFSISNCQKLKKAASDFWDGLFFICRYDDLTLLRKWVRLVPLWGYKPHQVYH